MSKTHSGGVNGHLHAHGEIRTNAERDHDPTQTSTLQSTWVGRFNARWRELRGAVRRELRAIISTFATNSDRDASAILNEFRNWFTRALKQTVVEPASPSAVRRGKHWTSSYVVQAYRAGVRRAHEFLSQRGYNPAPFDTFRAGNVQRSEHQETLRKAYVQTYHDLQDVASATTDAVMDTLQDALRAGIPVAEIIERVNSRIETIGQTRTKLVATTNTVRAVNNAALITYALIGVQQVGVRIETPIPETETYPLSAVGESGDSGPGQQHPPASEAGAEQLPADGGPTALTWVTANDDKVCAKCLLLEGRSWPLVDVMTGDAPRPPEPHPNCRCILTPTFVKVAPEQPNVDALAAA